MGTNLKLASFSMVAAIFMTLEFWNQQMVATQMSASLYVFVLLVLIQGNSEAVPVNNYEGVNSGVVRPISGVVPVSVPHTHGALNEILNAIRQRVDKSLVEELDASIRADIMLDELTPKECKDKYGIRDGVLKHTARGVRDVLAALIQDFQGLGKGVLKNLPLVPNVINGVGEAITYIICGAEDVVSDLVSGVDDGPDILTKLLVDLLELQGSAPLANIPAGIANVTKLIGKVGANIINDLVLGVELGIEDLAEEVASGVKDVVNDVEAIVSGVETDITNVVNAVEGGVQMIGGGVKGAVNMIGGGVGHGVSNIVQGIQGGLSTLVNAL